MKYLLILCMFASCTTTGLTTKKNIYPSIWWNEIPRVEAKSWEILPQDAKSGEVILSKRTELGVLSNFAATPFEIDGKSYPCIEGFWQMMKYPEDTDDERRKFPGLNWKFTRGEVAQMVGFDAKKAGNLAEKNMQQMKINWVTYQGKKMPYRILEKGDHYKLIRRAMRAKLDQNPEVKRILKATGDLILRPDHDQGSNVPPAWRYHEIWMDMRAEI